VRFHKLPRPSHLPKGITSTTVERDSAGQLTIGYSEHGDTRRITLTSDEMENLVEWFLFETGRKIVPCSVPQKGDVGGCTYFAVTPGNAYEADRVTGRTTPEGDRLILAVQRMTPTQRRYLAALIQDPR
jgi:hypothetical protein